MKFGRSVWHASRVSDFNDEIPQFKKPTEIITRPNYFSVMQSSTRGYLEILKYGETAQNHWTIIANGNAFYGKIKEGDVMWVEGEHPIKKVEETYGNGASANAIVKNVTEANQTISITLERNQNQILK